MNDPRTPHPGSLSPVSVMPPLVSRLLAGRFEVQRWLGEGGMGTVYLARDRKLDRRVALKVLLGGEPDALSRFKQEFRALADISHPNLIVLHELLFEEGTWLFTMDYVEGRDFLQHVSALEGRDAPTLLEVEAHRLREIAKRPLEQLAARCPIRDEAMLTRVLGQLVDAVASLHAAGKLHLDLKPSNVLVSANDHVTVLDFGLARDLKHAPELSTQRLLGTPAYMAPEHAQSGRFEPASDWYAVGVMLYEALTGRLPFEGPVAHILLSKTSRDPEPPSALCRDVPPRLEELCMELMARSPDQRPTGAEILRRFGERTRLPRSTPRSAKETPELFVGRGRVLDSMRAHSSQSTHPRMILLHGGSGVGKTTLARRFVDELSSRPRTLVLSGACYEREAMPFKAFDGVVDALIAHLSKLSAIELGALLPRRAHTLARLFPAFSALATPTGPSRGSDDEDPSVGRARAFRAFAELFGRLSDHGDVVLFIDDLHWSDLDSALLLRALLEGPEPVPLLLIGTYRTDEAAHSPLLAELAELARENPELALDDAEVGALDRGEAEALASELLSSARAGNAQIAAQIAEESQGVPLFIHELVRHVLREDAAPGREVSLGEVLGARIAGLPRSAAALLEVLAAAGGPTPQRVAFRAAGLNTGQEAALHTLRVAGLARSRGAKAENLAETSHDRIRVVVQQRLGAQQLADTHARLLEAFADEAVQDDERLFMHSLGAGQAERALRHAERAAARAEDALAFHRAADLYRVALELLEREAPHDAERRGLLLRGLADALAATGHCLDSAQAYLQGLELMHGHAPELERRAADQLLRGGDLQRGTELLRRVLERVGISYPKSPRAALAALAFERARLFARGLAFEERAPSSIPARELVLLESLRVALGVYWLVEPVRGALFATLYLRNALEAGHARHVLRGLETEAAYVALTGGAKGEARSGELYAAARALTHRIGSASTRSGYKLAEAGFHAIYGRKEKSTECALEALHGPRQQGVSWEQAYARFHVYQNTLYIGGRPGLPEEIELAIEDAEQRRDRFGTATLLPMLALARLMQDEPAPALLALSRMRPLLSDDVFSFLDMQELIWTALSHQYAGDPEAALAHYADKDARYALSGMPRLSTWRVLHQWGAMLAHLAALEQGHERERHARAAEERIKQIERERIEWPLAFASAGRAALHHVAGELAARDRQLARAIHLAEALGYRPFVLLFARSAALFARDAAAMERHEAGLRELGVVSASGWQRTWAPCLR
jgi:eukaryotic-like serine/threonine-protein kinase